MYLYTFYGRDLIVFHSKLKRAECAHRFWNECKHTIEGEFYRGSKDKCSNCGFIIRIQGDFFWLNKSTEVTMTRRWYPFDTSEKIMNVLKVIGYELMVVEGMFSLIRQRQWESC